MWTVTTDPSVLSSDEALQSLTNRWHRVMRGLLRRYPGIRYFKVLEFTKSGLPHLHVLFDRFVDWHEFRKLLIHHGFGRVLQFNTVPKDVGFAYLTKYVTKSIAAMPYLRELRMRTWSASLHFLPHVTYFDKGTEFTVIWMGPLDWHVDAMLHQLGVELDVFKSP